jgi:biotin carboxyl carrier protein
MKKNCIANILFLPLMVLLLFACKEKAPQREQHAHHGHEEPAYRYDQDSTLTPLLKPVNEQVIAQIPAIRPGKLDQPLIHTLQGVAVYDTRSETGIASRVAGRIEKLYIKYNYQPVKKGQLIMQIYSPELVAAQRELLFIAAGNDDPVLLNSAKQRLLLLGMTAQQLEQVLRSRQPAYSVSVYSNAGGYIIDKAAKAAVTPTVAAAPASGDDMGGMNAAAPVSSSQPAAPAAGTPVMLREGQYVSAGENLFTIYKADKLVGEFAVAPSVAAEIRKGQALRLHSLADSSKSIAATIGLIQPVFRNGENFTLLRVYLQGQPFKAGELLKAGIPLTAGQGLWLPAAAVLQLGDRDVVFKKEGRVYKPLTIHTGMKAGGYIQVPDSTAAWDVAANTAYLVDSESFIK